MAINDISECDEVHPDYDRYLELYLKKVNELPMSSEEEDEFTILHQRFNNAVRNH